jgi:KAP family P-loop domain
MNEHIIDYLKYYINLEHSPQFAILLKGDWGCGKSFFIRRFIESEGKEKFIYTTLYGVNATKEINDQFFEQLHPLLSSKGMKVTTKIIKGFFKGALKIDIGEKGELDVESNLKNGELPAFLTNADSKVIIFDDLERCSMELATVMGYINQFVEINGNKVIILANEKEIIASEEKRKKNFVTTVKGKYDNKPLEADLEARNDSIVKYLRIKEKLIGKSFEVSSNMEGALKEFIGELRNHKLIELLTNELELIKTLFKESNYNNLRHLKQSILELERFYLMLPEIVFTKKNLVIDLISYFLCISFELKKGEFKEDDIKVLFVGNSVDGGSLFERLREKYSLDTFPLNVNLWFDFFGKGIFSSRQELEDSIKNSNYFYDEKTPAFIKIWRFRDLNDDDFQLLYEKVYNDFKRKDIEDQYLLLHITSMLIFYSEAGLIPLQNKM